MEKKILLKDLQAIIHGNITLVKWNEESEDYKTLYSTTHFNMMYVPENLQNMEVVDIHSDTEDTEQNFIHIELV